jgi:Glycosyl transferase family 11
MGNQMFQYAHGRTLEHDEGEEVTFDLSGLAQGPRQYALEPFHLLIKFGPATPDTLVAYWQSEKYFNGPLVREAFLRCRPPMLPFRESLMSNCVAVHVRLTDNLSERALAFHGNLLDTDYYDRAIYYMRRHVDKPLFLIFSDDPEWCQHNLHWKDSHVVWGSSTKSEAKPNPPHEDIWEMSRCPYAIIANSSFSWWGSFLGPQKIVVCPRRWFVVPVAGEEDIPCHHWIRL